MRSVLALLLPLALCSNSDTSSSEDFVQIQLFRSKTSSLNLIPIDLKSGQDQPEGLLDYGFIIDTKESCPTEIIVEQQTLKIPMNAKALLVTLSKHEGKYDIHLSSYLAPEFYEFKGMTLENHHVPIYLQLISVPAKAKHGQKQKTLCRREKEENGPAPRQSSSSTNYSKMKLANTAQARMQYLFSVLGEQNWPSAAFGHLHANGRAGTIQPLIQTANKCLAAEYFSISYNQGDVLAHFKVQNQLIELTEELEASKDYNNPHIIIEMNIVGKREDGSIIFPRQCKPKIRHASSEEVKGIPELESDHYNIYFQFQQQEETSSSDSSSDTTDEVEEEEPRKRKSRYRRQCRTGNSSESKSQ